MNCFTSMPIWYLTSGLIDFGMQHVPGFCCRVGVQHVPCFCCHVGVEQLQIVRSILMEMAAHYRTYLVALIALLFTL